MRGPSYTSLDDALETLAPYGTELRNGNNNHAPMVAEALCAMGRPDAVMPWVAGYRAALSASAVGSPSGPLSSAKSCKTRLGPRC